MYDIYAKIRMRSCCDKIKKVTSTSSKIYNDLSELVDSSVRYSNTLLLGEGEWFYLSDFSKQESSNEIIRQDIESLSTNSLEKELFNVIDFIFIIKDNLIFFSKYH